MFRPVVMSALALVLFGAGACGDSLTKLSEGEGPLANDAKAVLVALKSAGVPPGRASVYGSPDITCSRRLCAIVAVQEQRIVGLYVRGKETIDLRALAPCSKLRRLRLEGFLRGKLVLPSKGLVGLISANFSQNPGLRRVEGAGGLPRLGKLELGYTGLESLELANLPKLQTLGIGWTKLKRISLRKVGVRQLDTNTVQSVESLELADLPKLSTVYMRNSRLKKVSLRRLPKLSVFDVRGNLLEALTVTNLPALRQLVAAKNKLRALELRALPALKQLDVRGNSLERLPKVDPKVSLDVLYLTRNKLASLRGVEAFNPKALWVGGNKLGSLALGGDQPAAALQTRRLIADSNALTSLTGLKAFPELRYLAVYHNKLTTTAGIEGAPKLEYIVLDHNKLTALAGVGALTGLTILKANRNALTSLAGLEKLHKLHKLYVAHNQLTTLAPLSKARLEKLDTLMAQHNKLGGQPGLFGPQGKRRPKIKHYDLRHNVITGVATSLLYYGLTTRMGFRGSSVSGGGRSRGTSGGGSRRYRGSRGFRGSGTRYSGGGGYRYGK